MSVRSAIPIGSSWRRSSTVTGSTGATDTFSDILADDSIDVVDICTPHDSHAALAFEAIAAGKHVLVEKPIASRLADGIAMVEAAAEAGLALGVAEHQVYDESTRHLQGILDSGVLGQVVSAIATWGFRAPGFSYPGRRAWLTDPQRGGHRHLDVARNPPGGTA